MSSFHDEYSSIDCERSLIDEKLISIHSPGAKPGSSHEAIKTELDGKLIFDDERVFRRLGIDCIQNTFIDACLASLNNDGGIQRSKQLLDSLLLAKSDDEKKMYPPLGTSNNSASREHLENLIVNGFQRPTPL
ncbi:hypothetical protein K439DRAFT_413543 [Ramaria rubella]|nr:hypothetical protein K439DRAFT_413543 [Ramaria rubella]